jgi:hypothetical protein
MGERPKGRREALVLRLPIAYVVLGQGEQDSGDCRGITKAHKETPARATCATQGLGGHAAAMSPAPHQSFTGDFETSVFREAPGEGRRKGGSSQVRLGAALRQALGSVIVSPKRLQTSNTKRSTCPI